MGEWDCEAVMLGQIISETSRGRGLRETVGCPLEHICLGHPVSFQRVTSSVETGLHVNLPIGLDPGQGPGVAVEPADIAGRCALVDLISQV